jgi:hypothetical protein
LSYPGFFWIRIWKIKGVQFLEELRDFQLLNKTLFHAILVSYSSVAQIASYPMDTGGSFTGVKRLGREADHSPSSSIEVKMNGAVSPFPHTFSCRGAYLSTGQFYLSLYLLK